MLAAACEFQSKERLEAELCAQIIEGIRSKRTQRYFFETPNLTLDTVIRKAMADEHAEKGVAQLQKNVNPSSVAAAVSNNTTVNKVNARDFG